MFAESLLESSPHIGHRAGWAKLTSLLLQCTAVAVVLAVPLFHIERLQVLPPPPSIRLTSVQQPVVRTETTELSRSATSETPYTMLQPRSIPTTIARVDDRNDAASGAPQVGPLCTTNCGSALPITNIMNSTGFNIPKPPPPTHPVPVSEMKLGALVRKVLPEYPAIAKQMRQQGAVVLIATIGRDGRVENVQPLRGPALLVGPAMRAVEQWQYRPYILNHEPVEVQTEITVNFVLNQE
jgi:protein TonB